MAQINNSDASFVRSNMLPALPPPNRVSGPVKWLRDNLLSGPTNILLTLLGLGIVWLIVSTIGPWLMHSVWNASSMAECRQIIAERYGPDATGACFALIKDRWNQFVFGFYPTQLYWRPVMTFATLFFALTPILFMDSPVARSRIMAGAAVLGFVCAQLLGANGTQLALFALVVALWVALIEYGRSWSLLASLLWPFMAVWMLWGGSIWSEIGIVLGLVAGYLGWRLSVGKLGLISIGVAALSAALWWGFVAKPLAHGLEKILPLTLEPVSSSQFGGFVLSITLGVAGIAMSFPLGIILALARRSDLPVIKTLAIMFIEFIRGVPLIALLFVASLLLNYFLPPRVEFDIVLRVVIMVTLFASAYMAEVIRGGLAALPRGQYEAADALGLNYWQAQRLIILPQALKVSIPGIVSTFIGMFKDTTLVTFVGLYDPLKATSDTVRATFAWKGAYWEPYIFAGSIFFILCFGMSRYSMSLERRLKRENR